MIFKITGAFAITVSCLFTAFYALQQKKRRIDSLMNTEKALVLFKSEIGYSNEPLSEAFLNISEFFNDDFKDIFVELSDKLKYLKGESAYEIWKEVWNKKADSLGFKEEDKKAVMNFGKSLGYLDLEQQTNSIDILISYIRKKYEYLLDEYKTSSALYMRLGVLFGMIISIALA